MAGENADVFRRAVLHLAGGFAFLVGERPRPEVVGLIELLHLNDVWSYLLEASFGEACLAIMKEDALASFDRNDCLRIALQLRLPIWENGELPMLVDVIVDNTVVGSAFRL